MAEQTPRTSAPLERLMSQVAGRWRLARLGRRWFAALVMVASVYFVAVLATRLTGWHDWTAVWTLVLPPAVALLWALGLERRPPRDQIARIIDRQTRSKDLFLTASALSDAPGSYAPLVHRDAEEQASHADARRIVPWNWLKPAGRAAAIMLLLAATLAWAPRLDPFGVQEQQKQTALRRQALEEQKKKAEEKIEALKRQDLNSELSKPVELAVNQLKQTLQQAKPKEQAGNLQKLAAQQTQLEQLWQQMQQQRLSNSDPSSQRLGGVPSPQWKQWQEDLEAGRTDSMQRELGELQQMAEQMARSSDAEERQKLRQEMQQRMQQLADFASRQGQGQGGEKSQFSQAMQQALQQLDMSALQQMDQQALDAMEQSLQMSKLELEKMAQSQRDIEALKQAIKALQMAKQLNQQEALDGEKCEGCQSIADYQKMYEKMMAQAQAQGEADGQRQGQQAGRNGGMGGPGQGKGNVAPENDAIQTDYKTEQAQSQLNAGRILMSWKTREVSDPGEAKKEFQQSVAAVKQGVGEAILREQVPSGYHESIQRYFDDIEKVAPKTNE